MAGLASVARITYLVSDVLVNSQPTLPSKSPFADTFNALSEASSHRPTVIPVPLGADPGSTILQSHATGLTSYTASSHPEVLTRLVVHLAELSSLPVVLHLAVKDDLSDVLLLRSAVPFFLVSSTAQQAHDNALLASLLARNEKKAVVHVFYENTGEVAVEEIAEEKIRPFLLAEKPTLVNGHGLNGHGHVNGDGHLNGINGHTCPPSPTDVALQQLFKAYSTADLSTLALVRRSLRPLNHHGSSDPQTVIFALGRVPEISFNADLVGISFVAVSLLN